MPNCLAIDKLSLTALANEIACESKLPEEIEQVNMPLFYATVDSIAQLPR